MANFRKNLAGQTFDKLLVLEPSEKRGTRGKRTVPLWKCRCKCGNLTYKATDTLTGSDKNMCQACAEKYCVTKAREKAGFASGTQVTRINITDHKSTNISGVRGVYYDSKTGRYRARIKFQGKLYNLGSFTNVDDALKARQEGEEKFFKPFLSTDEDLKQQNAI